jgi:multidrug resistance efflux pump
MTSRPLFSALPFPLLALAAALALAGCSREDAASSGKQAPVAQAAAPYAAVARGKIDIEGGLLKLSVPRDGVVAEIKVHEGDHVKKGQLLVMLDTEPAKLAVTSAEAEQKQAEAQARLLDSRLQAADQRAQRLEAAAKAGAGDAQSADDAREAARQLQGELDNARANAALAAQKLAGARYELAQRSLLAPVDGEIVQRLIQPGALASPQSGPAFVLLPEQPRIVRAELNESFVRVVNAGMRAEVIDDSGSGMPNLTAHVLRVGTVFGASALEEDPLVRANTRTVECVLAFDQPPPASARIGQRVLVRFAADGAQNKAP